MSTTTPRIAGLFSGIGGLELGFAEAGWKTVGLCEIDEPARIVLKDRFAVSQGRLWHDVTKLAQLPRVDLVTAGFPCQDLSQAGRKRGISGSQSGLVSHVFRLIDESRVSSVLLENVSYMLRLDQGEAMRFLTGEFEKRGFNWGYRVVDARSFGIPQRRQRVVFLASRDIDPSGVLHVDDASHLDFNDAIGDVDQDSIYGFYWTEGMRGLGWTRDAVPTVKGGSGLGIPSPPTVWVPGTGQFGTPTIEDAEALQGFPRGWTSSVTRSGYRVGARWRLVGNAVCVPMGAWLADRITNPGSRPEAISELSKSRWPPAARGNQRGEREAVGVGARVFETPYSLKSFLQDPLKPLSLKAAAGFLRRAEAGKLRFADGFLESLYEYIDHLVTESPAA